jgi:tetratricopeptide (TPR) repeat protein
MNLRLLIRPVLALLLAPFAGGQQLCNGSDENARPVRVAANAIVPIASVGCTLVSVKNSNSLGVSPQPATEIPTKTELLRRISVYEAALRAAGPAHADDPTIAKAYARLASLYGDAAMYERSEWALEHAVSLLRSNTEWSSQLAEDLNYLGLLHGEMGKLRQAEREELEAQRLRENLGETLALARSWNALSALYFKERKYTISRDFAQRAMNEFSGDKQADVADKISSRLNLAIALCFMKECPSAVPLLKDTVAIAKAEFKPNDFPVGEGEYILGFAYWKSGDMTRASESMEQGVTIMKQQLGWGHPAYLNALRQYARFLREDRRADDAAVVERQIRQAESVVDVRSIQTRNGADGLAGLR